MTQPSARIGEIVRYYAGGSTDSRAADPGGFYVPALVTMTTEEWQPGWRGPDGVWTETPDVEQPKPGTVHLRVFWPTHKQGVTTPPPSDYAHVPYGTTHACWSPLAPKETP